MVTTIEVYADIWCPFAHVGLRAVQGRLAGRERNEIGLRIRAWPLELVNGRPQDAHLTSSHIRELREQIASDLFAGFDATTFPTTTLPALDLAAHAYRQSDLVGEAVSFALRDALFEEGRDVADRSVLGDIAARYGIDAVEARDRERVLEDWRHGQARGVKGSPHFFCGGKDVFCPSLDIERGENGRLLINRNREAIDAFLDGCLGN